MDFFLVAKYGPNQENAKKFIQLITDATVQTQFNQLFGAIPARIDADLSDATKFDEFDRNTQADIKKLGFTDRTENITASAWAKAMVSPIGKFVTAVRGVTDETIVNAAVDTAITDFQALCMTSQVCVD
jgi:ABC-type glycerol-3-phosphate transport system substrate-binding protein